MHFNGRSTSITIIGLHQKKRAESTVGRFDFGIRNTHRKAKRSHSVHVGRETRQDQSVASFFLDTVRALNVRHTNRLALYTNLRRSEECCCHIAASA